MSNVVPISKPAALTLYESARRALAEAHSVDEVKSITDKAAALQLYARMAQDRQLIEQATEIRMRAERRMGELMEEMPKAKGGGGKHGRKRVAELPTLKTAGVDKYRADRARKAAAMSDAEFEKHVAAAKKVERSRPRLDRDIVAQVRAFQDELDKFCGNFERRVTKWMDAHPDLNGEPRRQLIGWIEQRSIELQMLAQRLDGR